MELGSGPSGREFSGTCTRLLLEHVHACGGPAAVQAMLDLAGDPRPAADLLNDTIWTSYTDFRRLLEAASTTIGVPGATAVDPRRPRAAQDGWSPTRSNRSACARSSGR